MTINEYIEKLEQYANEHNINKNMYKYAFGCDEGPKYTRIWRGERWKNQYTEELGEVIHKSVFCFVDQEGNIYKPAGWKAPAKGARGHLDGFAPLDGADLYKRL